MFWRNVFEYAERMELSFMGRTLCFLWDVICYRKFKATMWYYWSGWLWKVTKVDVYIDYSVIWEDMKWSEAFSKSILRKRRRGKKMLRWRCIYCFSKIIFSHIFILICNFLWMVIVFNLFRVAYCFEKKRHLSIEYKLLIYEKMLVEFLVYVVIFQL